MPYLTPRKTRQLIKDSVFKNVGQHEQVDGIGRELYRVAGHIVHVRYCAPGRGRYKFNLNPNTLRADYELWICGSEDHWYLIPVQTIKEMYDHPSAYPDRHHAKIRVVSVDVDSHSVGYAAPSIKLDLSEYFGKTLTTR